MDHSGTKFLIAKNLKNLLELVLEDISDFKQQTQMKFKSFAVLNFIISQCGLKIQPDAYTKSQGIFTNVFKYIDSEELNAICEESAKTIGKYTDQNILIPLIVKTITEMEPSTTYQPLFVRIKFIANYLNELKEITIDNANLLVTTLNTLDIFNIADSSFSTKILFYLYHIYSSLIRSLGSNSSKFHEQLFFPLLLLSALPENVKIKDEVIASMKQLANLCGFDKIEDLYSLEMGHVLEKFKSSYKNWKRNSPDRFAFDIYVKLAGTALEKHWTEVLLIISQCCEAEKDIEMRMDMILLLDRIIQEKELKDQLINYTEFILPEILFPATAWKAGRPNYKIRKAAMLDMIHMYLNGLIDSEVTFKFFGDFKTILTATLEDDWEAELRYLALQLLKQFLMCIGDTMKYDHMSELYTMILKRLDDSQDANRILTCEVLILFLRIGARLKISESIYEHMIQNSFIHLDDPNEKVREAVKNYLLEASKIHPKCFLNICEKNAEAFTHQSLLNEVKVKAEEELSKKASQ